jgi:hypothetical protein
MDDLDRDRHLTVARVLSAPLSFQRISHAEALFITR